MSTYEAPVGQRAADLLNGRTTGFVFAIPGVLIVGRDVVEHVIDGVWHLAYRDASTGEHTAQDADLTGAYLKLIATRLDVGDH